MLKVDNKLPSVIFLQLLVKVSEIMKISYVQMFCNNCLGVIKLEQTLFQNNSSNEGLFQ